MSVQQQDDLEMAFFENVAHSYLEPTTGSIGSMEVTRALVYNVEMGLAHKAWHRFNSALNGIIWLIEFRKRYEADYPLPHQEKDHKSDRYDNAIFDTIRQIWPPSPTQADTPGYRRIFRHLNRRQIRYAFMSQLFGVGILFDDSICWSRFQKWTALEWQSFVKCFNSEAAQASDLVKTWKGVKLV